MSKLELHDDVVVCLCRCGGANLLIEQEIAEPHTEKWLKSFKKPGDIVVMSFDRATHLARCDGSCSS